MQEFMVRFRCVRDIQEFVLLASGLEHKLMVGNDKFQVNATSYIGVFSLNCRRPLKVTVQCSADELSALKTTFAKFLAA